MSATYKVILAHILNPFDDNKCEFIEDGALLLKKSKDHEHYSIDIYGQRFKLLEMLKGESSLEVVDRRAFLLMPSFFDVHFHWVQDDVRSMPKADLLYWLENYTWPHEAKFSSVDYSLIKAQTFASDLKKVGTLGGVIYSSIHPHTVDQALELFLGDFVVGNVLMTMNSPANMIQTDAEALAQIKIFSEKFKNRYAVTPRIAPVTSPRVMTAGAEIAKKNNSFIQTHLSETKSEIEWVLHVFKNFPGFEDVKTYTEIYDRCKLLGPRTFLGHCIHLAESEWQLIARKKSCITHCPTSNDKVEDGGLGSGLFDFLKAEKYGIPWALGSDIGGGPYLSMFDVIQSFVSQNRKAGKLEATFTKALFRATLKGAQLMNLDDKTGNLVQGKSANFILTPLPRKVTPYNNAEEVLTNLIGTSTDNRETFENLIYETYHQGYCVYQQ